MAVYRGLAESLARIRAGGPAEMIEFVLYRMTPHSSSDDPGRYQPGDWMARARAHDPLDRLERWLMENGMLDAATSARVLADADEKVRAAIRAAESTPAPPPSSLTEGVFRDSAPTPVAGNP